MYHSNKEPAHHLGALLRTFEAKRRKTLAKMIAFVLFGFSLSGYLAFVIAQDFTLVGIVASFFGLLSYSLTLRFFAKRFIFDFKEQVVGYVIKAAYPAFDYTPRSGIAQEQFNASGLYPHLVNRYNGSDLIQGQLDKVSFRYSQIHAEHVYNSTSTNNDMDNTTTVFKGQFFIADFHKYIHGHTIVKTNTSKRSDWWKDKKVQEESSTGADMEPIRLEDPEFERSFVVYSTDQVEARYILTPSMMQRLMRLQTHHPELRLSFLGPEVYLALPTKRDLFEPTFLSPIDRPELVQENLDDLQRLEDLVEELNLNTRIWTKE